MRTETEEIRDNLKYLSLLARDYPSQAAAASEIISTQALLKLPKGTEHFMSDLHGENEAFVHIPVSYTHLVHRTSPASG